MPPQASAGRIETQDIDAYQQIIPPWQVILRQMSPGRFRGRMEYVQVNGILIYREHWTQRVLATGATPAGFFMFGGPASPRTRIDWCGSKLDPQCLAYGAPSTEVDFLIPQNSHHVAVLVPDGLLRRYLGEESAAVVLRDGHFLGCQSGCGNALLDMIDRLIEKYLAHSELLANVQVCRAIEWQLLGSLTELLCTASPEAGCLPPSKRRLAVRRAIEHAVDLRGPMSVPELAVAAGVSQRVLELGFKEATGATPREFLRWNRMNRAQGELLAAKACSSSVTQVASRWGFGELGRFAVEYKRLFGESPSTTLTRNLRTRPRRIADLLPQRH